MAAIEVTAGDVRKQLDILIGHMTLSDAGFGVDTFPNQGHIDTAINAARAEILAWFAAYGYNSDDTTWSNVAKDFIGWYNALGAAYRLEMAHTGLQTSPTPGTRAELYYQMYNDLKEQLKEKTMDFSDIGVPISESQGGRISQTGHTQTDKQTQEDNPDAVQPYMGRRHHRDFSV